jgi:hypothetical protein
MTKKTAYRGHPKQFLAPVRARNVIGGHAPGVAHTRERSNVAKNASIPGAFKSPGVNGAGYHDPRPAAYHSNAGMMRKK